jgi:hypothetical protein
LAEILLNLWRSGSVYPLIFGTFTEIVAHITIYKSYFSTLVSLHVKYRVNWKLGAKCFDLLAQNTEPHRISHHRPSPESSSPNPTKEADAVGCNLVARNFSDGLQFGMD